MITCVLLSVLVICVNGFSPYEHGPHNTSHLFIDFISNLGLPENVDVWVPNDAGTFKTFYFLDGFGGAIPGAAYNDTMNHLASHGFAVVIIWRMTLPLDPMEKLPIFEDVMVWLEKHLEDKLHANGVPDTVHLDLENIVLGGHSAGNHVVCEYLKSTCGKIKGQVLMSPVDGVEPSGTIDEFCITPGQTLNFNIPTLHLSAGLDNVPGLGGLACAPDELSNDRYYDALDPNSQRWSINATEFGHGDFLDPFFQETIEITNICGFNADASDEYLKTYRTYVGAQTMTFMKALFTDTGDCSEYLPYLQDPQVMSVDTELKYENPIGGCPIAGCLWWPQEINTTTSV